MHEPLVTAEVLPNPGSVAEKTIPVRVPTWNTPEFPAERPREEDMLAGRHQLIVEYLLNALVAILRKWNRPFEVVTERGLYFELDGRWSHCDPDIMVLPFELEGDGALRRRDMSEAPLCVFEIASPETVNKDLVQKKAWYAEMGIAEYWMVDPVSASTEAVRTGALIEGGPLQGWQLGANGRYHALSVIWQDEEQAWVGCSPVLRHELILSQVLHGRRRDGGFRLRDPVTKATVHSHEEMLDDHETLAADHEELQSSHEALAADHEELQSSHEALAADHEALTTSHRDALADREELVFNLVAATHDPDVAQRMQAILDRAGMPLPATGLVMTWLASDEGLQFLNAVRRHCGLPDKE